MTPTCVATRQRVTALAFVVMGLTRCATATEPDGSAGPSSSIDGGADPTAGAGGSPFGGGGAAQSGAAGVAAGSGGRVSGGAGGGGFAGSGGKQMGGTAGMAGNAGAPSGGASGSSGNVDVVDGLPLPAGKCGGQINPCQEQEACTQDPDCVSILQCVAENFAQSQCTRAQNCPACSAVIGMPGSTAAVLADQILSCKGCN